MAYSVRPISQVCCELLKIQFGEIVASVGGYLLRRGNRSVGDIGSATGLSSIDTKKALAIMIQHNLVKFWPSAWNPNHIEFSVVPHRMYCLLRYPKYLYMIKRMFGDGEEMLLEVLLNQGQSSASNVIFLAVNRLMEAHEESGQLVEPSQLYDKFVNMVSQQFFIRCPELIASDAQGVPKFNHGEENNMNQFLVPPLDFVSLIEKLKEKSSELGEYSDSNIIWRVNLEKFDAEMRNVVLVNAAARRVDTTGGELYHLLLQLWSQHTTPNVSLTNSIDLHQIKDAVRKSPSSSMREHFEQYLRVLAEDSSELVTKSGDAGGGQYRLDFKAVFEKLASATLDSIVLEKFGSKALRLFRVVKAENFIEHDPMHTSSMLLPKEVKMFSYKLVEHNFLQMQELKKGNSSGAPVKSFILFYVDLPQVARTALELCYKGLFNVLVRKEYIDMENKRLLEKHQRLETLLLSLREEGATEEDMAYVEESMTPAEKSLVCRINNMADLFTLGELKVDESILILESYLHYIDGK